MYLGPSFTAFFFFLHKSTDLLKTSNTFWPSHFEPLSVFLTEQTKSQRGLASFY